MAQKIVRASDGKEVKPAESVKKAAEPVKKAAEETAKKPVQAAKKAGNEVQQAVKQSQQNIVAAKPTKGSSVLYRVLAFVLWALAITCEIFAIMALTKSFVIQFKKGAAQTNILLTLILFIVLDLALAIIAAQLWKKANHIKPMSEKNKFLFYLWNELGVIMAAICFIPLLIVLIKNDKLDKKTKTIATVIAAAALLIAGFASADYAPVSSEQKEEAMEQITQDVYWTPGGHKYHLKIDSEEGANDGCYHLRRSSTVIVGSIEEAINSGKSTMCKYCAENFAAEKGIDISKLYVEGMEAPAEENKEENQDNNENNNDEGGAENGSEAEGNETDGE